MFGWMDFELLSCSDLISPFCCDQQGNRSSWGPSPNRHTIGSKKIVFPFFFFFVALPDSFENKLKIVCRHNLQEHSTASKIRQLSSLVLVHTMNLKEERKRYL